jgi:prolyl oligopeptidase
MTDRQLKYPSTPRGGVIDDYHGTLVPDPYRWLEDPHSASTRAWIDAQNALTRSVLDGPSRNALVARLTDLHNYPRGSVPIKRGGRCFFTYNTGLQNQAVLFVQDAGTSDARPLLDPNELSADGTTALTAVVPNNDGSLVAYGLSRSGSDRQEILVREAASGGDLEDRIEWVKFASIAWVEDGFYYTRFPAAGSVSPGDENYSCSVHFHRLGDPQHRDRLIFERPERREVVFEVDTTPDERWLVITSFEGASDKSEVHILDRRHPEAVPIPLVTGFSDGYHVIDAVGARLYLRTDWDAPLGRIVCADLAAPARQLTEVVPQGDEKLSLAVIAGDRLVASYLHDASDRLRVFSLTGEPQRDVPLPGLGSVTGLSGRPGDRELFFGYASFTQPPITFRHDVRSEGPAVRRDVPGGSGDSRAVTPGTSTYSTAQVWFRSKDGTAVSMFLVHRADLQKDGNRPVLLGGYGGFNISLTPAYDPAAFPLLEAGGIYGIAHLRGGGEYGERWHEAGMRERKQNVFDDFIAAAEWLIAEGWTRPSRIAIEGGSNGGLLTGAVILQRPDLFGAVLCRVPVVDMLRYHLFTVGRFWIPEYGCADDPRDFPFLYEYSPYHNVRDGEAYPPILITTADTDDRVDPGMARKFAARLQANTGNSSAVLIRVEIRAGHGAGKPTAKMIDEDADMLAFVFRYLSV